MAQAATMGPPLSPRETRRSGRRSAPSVSASASKSPDSDQPSMGKASSSRAPAASASNRNKRLKQEDYDDASDDRKNAPVSSTASSTSQNGSSTNKAKRKIGKEKDKDKDKHPSSGSTADADTADAEGQPQDPVDEEEEQGITRCVCGSAEDDPDAGEFMVQCEGCKAWQHGLCMGYQSEDQLHDDDYYCELCKPDLHVDLLKKLAKKQIRQASTARQGVDAHSRVSRSHSPSHLLKQPSKRRNTMNSRDAAFDESLKEIIEATAAEAAAIQDSSANDSIIQQPDVNENKKKRKRAEEDTHTKKRTRSASTASDRHSATAPPAEIPMPEKPVPQAPKAASAKNKRGGRKAAAAIEITVVDAEEIASLAPKRPANNQRAKAANNAKKPPLSQAQGGGGQHVGTGMADARAYRSSHAYAVSQPSLYTSWGLPDHLAHLEQILPTEVPQPLEVRAGGSNSGNNGRGESAERTMERGVKVRWPTKRLSVGDMNKRVRALVEWVGREQANALDRGRRREALEKALREQAAEAEAADPADHDVQMISGDLNEQQRPPKPTFVNCAMSERALEISERTMKTMEELMEELIGFQERFGPGAKNRERERKTAS
ncbi:unnamed protein product [Cyclocybe aegerita]|uniref:PHD-type domain-containing protein n=1 Tax=Cyclocybe aegerita TaxID=1973307 RepID=A0A8S0WXY4_CYCAE|nr:unnamed protein product [Cyclocybe aegerita]